MHHTRYKSLFAFPRMVEYLPRGFAAREWANSLDFSSLRQLPAEYMSDERLVRRADTVWQVCLHDRRPVLVVLEFQSSEARGWRFASFPVKRTLPRAITCDRFRQDLYGRLATRTDAPPAPAAPRRSRTR